MIVFLLLSFMVKDSDGSKPPVAGVTVSENDAVNPEEAVSQSHAEPSQSQAEEEVSFTP